MAVIGMTGSGKSVLTARLLDLRQWYIVLKSKADRTKYPRAKTVQSSSVMDDPRESRIILQPTFQKQGEEFAAALGKVWKQGGWTISVDETYYLDAELRLHLYLNRLLTQGRDPGRISVVCGMQRPTSVTRFAIGEASHVISFGLEGRDVKILKDATSPRLADCVEELPRFHFGWYSVPERRIWAGKLNLRTGEFEGSYQ